LKIRKNFLTRANLRDVIILCSFASSLFCSVSISATVVGFFLIVIGCFLHMVAKGILVRNVVLCNRGIYGIVRHPYYLANYLIDTSFCVLSGNPYLFLAYPFLFFWSYGPTLREEERFLASKHGASFVDDNFRIPQVFPDRSALKGWTGMLDGFSVKRVSFKECSRIARFCSTGFAIVLVRLVKFDGLAYLFHPSNSNYALFLFMLLAVTFFFISLIFTGIARSNRGERDSS
jgi:protein-S-isoprenylcysteine O-methyltransferase Ste14